MASAGRRSACADAGAAARPGARQEVAQRHLEYREHRQQLDAGRLHARGPGERHRSRRQVHLLDARFVDDLAAAIDGGAQDLVRVVVDEHGAGAGLQRLPRRADHEGGLAALRDRERHVPRADAEVADLLSPERGEVLEALHGLDQRVVAASHDAERALLHRVRDRASWRRARGVLPEGSPDRDQLDAEAPGRPAAREEQPAAAQQGRDDLAARMRVAGCATTGRRRRPRRGPRRRARRGRRPRPRARRRSSEADRGCGDSVSRDPSRNWAASRRKALGHADSVRVSCR